MPRFGPVKREELVRYLGRLGFEGPYSGGRHQFMIKGTLRVWVPNPHRGDIRHALLGKILREAGVSRSEWEEL